MSVTEEKEELFVEMCDGIEIPPLPFSFEEDNENEEN